MQGGGLQHSRANLRANLSLRANSSLRALKPPFQLVAKPSASYFLSLAHSLGYGSTQHPDCLLCPKPPFLSCGHLLHVASLPLLQCVQTCCAQWANGLRLILLFWPAPGPVPSGKATPWVRPAWIWTGAYSQVSVQRQGLKIGFTPGHGKFIDF